LNVIDSTSWFLECVVGSQLHGTATPSSDTDIRRVVVSPLSKVLSPFGFTGSHVSVGPNGDIEVHELSRFLKLLCQCNVTALEILWSNRRTFYRDELMVLWKHRHKVLDVRRLAIAASGYAVSQRRHVDRLMAGDGETPDGRRAGKFAAAYVRVLSQAIVLIRDGDYSANDVGPYRSHITAWKSVPFCQEDYRAFMAIAEEQNRLLAELEVIHRERFVQDIAWIDEFCRDVYVAYDGDLQARRIAS
jgi:hypothetical protein